ncbi:unnamed protein product, partial [Lymnaea stagnalis]
VSCLARLHKHHLIKENRKAKDIIFNAILYQTKKYRNGTWSNADIHRDCSELGNFGIYCYGYGKFGAYSITDKKFELTGCPGCVLSVRLVVFDNELYACGRTSIHDANSTLFRLRGNVWGKVMELT